MRQRFWLFSLIFLTILGLALLMRAKRFPFIVVEGVLPELVGEYLLQLTDLDGDAKDEIVAIYYGSRALLLEMRGSRFVSTELPTPTFAHVGMVVELGMKANRYQLASYLGVNGDAVAVTKDLRGKLRAYPFAKQANCMRIGDWDGDGRTEELLVCTDNGRVLRLFKKEPNGMVKQVSVLNLPASLPSVDAIHENKLLSHNPFKVFSFEIRNGEIVLLPEHKAIVSRTTANFDCDEKPELIVVERDSLTKLTTARVYWGDPKVSAEIPLGKTDSLWVQAVPFFNAGLRDAVFCLKSEGLRWVFEVWDVKRKGGKIVVEQVAKVSGNWNFAPTAIEGKPVDFDDDADIDILIKARSPKTLTLLFLRQTEKGWEAKLEGHSVTGYIPLDFILGSPTWLIRSTKQQVLTRTLTYWRLHPETVWQTELSVMNEEGRWQRKFKLDGRPPNIPPSAAEFVEFTDLNLDRAPELVTLMQDAFGFDRAIFWLSEPRKGWRGFDLGPTPLEQFSRIPQRRPPITLRAVAPIRWDDSWWLTLIWDDGVIKAVKVRR